MRTICLFTILVTVVLKANAQKDSSAQVKPAKHFAAKDLPVFPGGIDGLMEFVAQHTNYPEAEMKKRVEGTVMVRFAVNENGWVDDVKVMQAVSPGLDSEAVRVVKILPRFTPADSQGKAVKIYMQLPFVFKLNEKEEKKPDKIAELKKAIKLKSDKDKDFKDGIALMDEGKFGKALRFFKKSVEEYPGDYLGFELLAQCEAALGKTKESCADYQIAKDLGSADAGEYIKQNCK